MALRALSVSVRVLLNDFPRKSILHGARQSGCLTCQIGAKRYLLSEDIVKLQDFQQRKLAVAHRLLGVKDEYFECFNQKLQRNELILKDELKQLLHLCQTADDMVTARAAIYRYHEENRNVSFGEFKFGPLFIRLCYELGLEDMAVATLTDRSMKGFFLDSTSFNIGIDMLFTKGCYEKALDVMAEMRNQGVPFSKDTFTLAFATCYKLNSQKSYKICTVLLEEGQMKGTLIPRQAFCFATALALKQKDLEKAQNIYSQIMNTESRLCTNLRVLILATSGSIKEALSVLSSALIPESPLIKKLEFCGEVVKVLQRMSVDGPWTRQVEQLLDQLQQAGQVTQLSMDDLLCHTPPGKRKPVRVLEERKSRRTLRPLKSSLFLE
ncbi:pentatricopeptide repeat-containing protein 2, mitochondrial [Denticeps clupeoides]|uniref:Pentatricopeptide repeat-containing protein 2, mitochondrial n=1 Tax=Denticeps clupeoides TaxID=299321 RepID=A0AAY4AS52_9TELE|nr:pentatricopeptide repeat-containing protein 2, mitochondrial [Denticeps clupeoides]